MKIAKCTFLAAAMLSMTACNNEDLQLEVVDTTSNCIVLSVNAPGITDEYTRGTSINSVDDITAIGLIGLRYPASSSLTTAKPADYIYNDNLDKGTTNWLSHYSWPGAANKVSLFAYIPYGAPGLTLSGGSVAGLPFFTYTVPNQAENNVDVMVADTLDMVGNSYKPVKMNFKHICARVRVCCYGGTVSSVNLKYVNDTGTYTYQTGWSDVRKSIDASVVSHTFTYPLADNAVTPDSLIFYFPPQTVPDDAELEVNFADGTTRISTDLANDVWREGETVEYKIYRGTSNFVLTKGPQVFEAPETGTYKIECWGAQGGRLLSSGYTGTGGKGGYSAGTISLSKGTLLYVYVGTYGGDWKSFQEPYALGGYNGGGSAYNACGGGGATDVRTISGTWDNVMSLKSRIIVAGGGGGGNDNQVGGYGGGLISGNGVSSSNSAGGLGSNQISGGKYNSAFGIGGSEPNTDGGAGGGGWYGGGHAHGNAVAGGGGTSYISGHLGCRSVTQITDATIAHQAATADGAKSPTNLVFTTTTMFDGQGYQWTTARTGGAVGFLSPAGVTEVGHPGDGYCRITKL